MWPNPLHSCKLRKPTKIERNMMRKCLHASLSNHPWLAPLCVYKMEFYLELPLFSCSLSLHSNRGLRLEDKTQANGPKYSVWFPHNGKRFITYHSLATPVEQPSFAGFTQTSIASSSLFNASHISSLSCRNSWVARTAFLAVKMPWSESWN
jgi:hypothetical protein